MGLQTMRALDQGCFLLKVNLSRITTLYVLQSPFVLDAHGFLVRNVELRLLSPYIR